MLEVGRRITKAKRQDFEAKDLFPGHKASLINVLLLYRKLWIATAHVQWRKQSVPSKQIVTGINPWQQVVCLLGDWVEASIVNAVPQFGIFLPQQDNIRYPLAANSRIVNTMVLHLLDILVNKWKICNRMSEEGLVHWVTVRCISSVLNITSLT